MTDHDLGALRRLEAEATPGEWSAADEHGLLPNATPAWCVSRMDGEKYLYDVAYTTGREEQADAEFIAAFRNAARWLLDQADATQAIRSLCDEAERNGQGVVGVPFLRVVLDGEQE